MLELLTLFGVAATGVLAGGMWDAFGAPDGDDTLPEVEQAAVSASDESTLLTSNEEPGDAEPDDEEPGVEQISDYDSESEMLLIGVPPDYDGAGKIAIAEAETDPGTAVVSLDGSAVAEVPGAYGSLSLSGVELVELDNFA